MMDYETEEENNDDYYSTSNPPPAKKRFLAKDEEAVNNAGAKHAQNYTELAKFDIKDLSCVDTIFILEAYLDRHGEELKGALRIVRTTNLFGSFFSLVRMRDSPIVVDDGERGDDKNNALVFDYIKKYAEEHTALYPNEDEKSKQKRNKMIKRAYKECAVPALLSACANANVQFDVIIPFFGCKSLDRVWSLSQFPFDLMVTNPELAFKSHTCWFVKSGYGGATNEPDGFDFTHDLYNIKLKSRYRSFDLVIGVNLAALSQVESDTLDNKSVPFYDFLSDQIRWSLLAQNNELAVFQNIRTDETRMKQVHPDEPLGLSRQEAMERLEVHPRCKLVCTLFDYQKDALAWMVNIENASYTTPVVATTAGDIAPAIKQQIKAPFWCKWFNFYYDPIANTLCKSLSSMLPKASHSLPFKGALLGDEMGLGKTVEMTALVLANPMTHSPKLLMRADGKPTKTNTRPMVCGGAESLAIFESRATLVVVPNHLATNVWKKIFVGSVEQSPASSSSPSTKDAQPVVIVATTKHAFEKITVKQLMNADLVIVSIELIATNEHYLRSKEMKMDNPSCSTTDIAAFKQYWKTVGDKCRQIYTSSSSCNPQDFDVFSLVGLPLHLFHWHRLVVDEAHDTLTSSSFLAEMLRAFSTRYTWCLTGTPFSSYESLQEMCALLGMYDDFYNGPVKHHDSPTVAQKFRLYATLARGFRMVHLAHQLMWRSTKQGVAEQLAIPPMIEEIHMLHFTPTESIMYAEAARNNQTRRQRQLCCHLQLSDEDLAALGAEQRTLAEVADILIASRKTELNANIKTRAQVETTLARKQAKLDRLVSSHPAPVGNEAAAMIVDVNQVQDEEDLEMEMAVRQTKVVSLKEQLEGVNKAIDKLEREVAYFEKVLELKDSVQLNEETGQNYIAGHSCSICLEDAISSPAITSCGHLFCNACIEECAKVQRKCPICRKVLALTMHDILPFSLQGERNELSRLVNQYGTKLGNVIHHLQCLWQENPQAKVVIFSRWDNLLTRVGTVLSANNIRNVFCKGNVHVKDKALREFVDPASDVKVMMLSVQKAGSGSNLTIASEIIFLDSMLFNNDAEKGECLEGELQALNRSHRADQKRQIKIVRFLIRNSVEEDAFRNANPGFDVSARVTTRNFEIKDVVVKKAKDEE